MSAVEGDALEDGWDDSAAAWIADMGETGDFGRRFVLDAPMMARAGAGRFEAALDVGCGEGRFCRMLGEIGVKAAGIDPTAALIAQARTRDPNGDYRIEGAEALSFGDASFDLVVSYLTLIDIPDAEAAIREMARVLKPGGTLLIANLSGFNTAGDALDLGWKTLADGRRAYAMDDYLNERPAWVAWRGIRIQNWHRPLSTYMSLLLGQGLTLTHFAEPEATGGEPAKMARYNRVPWFLIMEWRKPDATAPRAA